MSIPNPMSLIKKGAKNECKEVEQLGIISLSTLHAHHCYNPERRLLSLFGTVYDVTSSEESYGKDGAYKEYAGHDVTLALAKHKTDEKWMDRFVKMEEKWVKDVAGWKDYFGAKYPTCGRLENWENNQPEQWPELSPEELEELEKGCTIM
jgi:cytochrome b involved in lipid metabolism